MHKIFLTVLVSISLFVFPLFDADYLSARSGPQQNPTHSRDSKTSQTYQTAQNSAQQEPAEQSQQKTSIHEDEVSFFFDDADIFEVVQTVFGEVLKVNYIIDPNVKGRVNFRTVTPISKDKVLSVMDIIFRLNAIGFVEEEGLYRIVPIEEVSRELIYSQVGKDPDKVAMALFTLKNVNLGESMKDIENAIGLSVKGGNLRILPIYRLNSLLIVASSNQQLDYVSRWVETFDVIFEGARPNVFVYPVQNGKAKDIANMLTQIFLSSTPSAPAKTKKPQQKSSASSKSPSSPLSSVSFSPSGSESLVSQITRIFPDETTNSIIILATPEDYELISETIKKIDIVPRQVMLEAVVASVTLTDNLRFGLQWTIENEFTLQPFNNDINISGPLTLDVPISDSLFTFTALDAGDNIKLLIQSLAEDNRAKVLSAPHILVSDNREAKIQVGDQVPIATQLTTNTETTPAQTTTTIQYKDTGTILKVKPQVNDSGLVALEITQEVSVADTTLVLGTEQFVIRKREVTTNLVAQDGQTIVIGGLIDEQKTKSRAGVPFLYKIPILGYLFGSKIDDTTRTELIVLLTPHVIKNQAESSEVSSGYIKRMKEADKDIKNYIIPEEPGQKDRDAEDADAGSSQ
jgi:general secretion pathway protein D